MKQVLEALKSMQGEISVKSTENLGTEFILTFPQCDAPVWFSDEIILQSGDTVVVLDDDLSIFDVWKSRFSAYGDDISVKYFTKGQEAIDFINSCKEKDKIFLITDYELRGQNVNGVDVIEQTGRQNRNMIVTSVYNSRIKNFNEKCEHFKMFHKTAGIEKISLTLE